MARGLACIAAGVTLMASIAIGMPTSTGSFDQSGIGVAVDLGCLAVVFLILLPPNVRRFFAQDPTGPTGVLAGCVMTAYLGVATAIAGISVMPAGALQQKYVGLGAGLAFVGLCFMLLVPFLRAGRPGARFIASLGFAANGTLAIVVSEPHGSLSGVIPAALSGISVLDAVDHAGSGGPLLRSDVGSCQAARWAPGSSDRRRSGRPRSRSRQRRGFRQRFGHDVRRVQPVR